MERPDRYPETITRRQIGFSQQNARQQNPFSQMEGRSHTGMLFEKIKRRNNSAVVGAGIELPANSFRNNVSLLPGTHDGKLVEFALVEEMRANQKVLNYGEGREHPLTSFFTKQNTKKFTVL